VRWRRRVAPAASRADLTHVVVSRRSVESGDVTEALTALSGLLVSAATYRERVDLTFAGYGERPAELWDIDEVRAYVARLDERFPYWLYFLSKETEALLVVAACLTRPAPVRPGGPGVGLVGAEVAALLEERWFPGLNAVAELTGLSHADTVLITERTTRYFRDGPLPPAR
jgi:hypothetical protein